MSLGIRLAGDIDIQEISLTLNTGVKIDVSSAFADIHLYEDMFSHTIHGSITLSDGEDLLANGPLYGEEIIVLRCRTPGLDPKYDINYTGIIYKISDRHQVTDKLQLYTLHFTSPEMLISENKKISRNFNGKIHSHIIEILTTEALLGTEKPYHIDVVRSSINFTSPYWSPLKIIEWMTPRAISVDGVPDLLFFETLTKGFLFNSTSVSINTPPIDTLWRGGAHTQNTVDSQFSKIQELYCSDISDYLKRVQSGVYASRLITANTMTKSLQMRSLTAKEYFPQTPHMNQFDVLGKNTITSKNSKMISYIDQEFSFNNQRDFGFQNWLLQRAQLFGRLHTTFKVDVGMPGRFDIGVSKTVNLHIDQSRQIGERDQGSLKNEYLSGKYLITAVCHVINAQRKHEMSIQCVTDSLSKELP